MDKLSLLKIEEANCKYMYIHNYNTLKQDNYSQLVSLAGPDDFRRESSQAPARLSVCIATYISLAQAHSHSVTVRFVHL